MTETRIGSIYKIICSKSSDVYVGSTFNALRTRMQGHKKSFERGDGLTIYPHAVEHGWKSLKMILIATYEVCDRKHLMMYETLWIHKLKACNKMKNPIQILKPKPKPKPIPKQLPSWQKRVSCECGGTYLTEDKGYYIRSYLHIHIKSNAHKNWAQTSKPKTRSRK
jgi:GIY-YIG catalytic domain